MSGELRLAASRNPQCRRKGGDKNGRESGNGCTICFNKLAAAANAVLDKADPAAGYVVIRGTVRIGGLMLLLQA